MISFKAYLSQWKQFLEQTSIFAPEDILLTFSSEASF